MSHLHALEISQKTKTILSFFHDKELPEKVEEVELTHEKARRLNEYGADLKIEPGSKNCYKISAGKMVGRFGLDNLTIFIQPKFPYNNLFHFLGLTLKDDSWKEKEESLKYGRIEDLLELTLHIYARNLENTLACGLLHSYREQEDQLIALRGRIDIAAQFRQAGLQVPVACRYDEYTPDNLENRYLKAALLRARQAPRISPEVHSRLLRQAAVLEEVTDVRGVKPEDQDKIIETRLNKHYSRALDTARFILENMNLNLKYGDRPEMSFLIDMNKKFEDGIKMQLKKRLKDSDAGLRLKQPKKYNFGKYDASGTHFSIEKDRELKPDLVFEYSGHKDKVVFVADIKYRIPKDADAIMNDYYQLLAYTTGLNLTEGVLIYCADTDEGGVSTTKKDDLITSTFTPKNTDKKLHTIVIDLSGSFTDMDTEMDKLANWIKEAANKAKQDKDKS